MRVGRAHVPRVCGLPAGHWPGLCALPDGYGGKGLADTLGHSWARQGNWSFLAAVVLTAATMSLLLAAAVTLSTRQAATVAEVVFLLLLGLWRLRVAVLALLPLPPLGVAVFHSLMPAITASCAVAVAAGLMLLAGRVRLRSPHLWIAALAGAALVAYLFPQARYEQPGVPLHALFMAGLGLLALAVGVMAPPEAGAAPARPGRHRVPGVLAGPDTR
jgi:hypothetical protein